MAKKTSLSTSIIICLAVTIIIISIIREASANIDSTRSQIIALADAGKLTMVDEAIDKLIDDYNETDELYSNLLIIADSFAWRRLYERTGRLYSHILENTNDSSLTTRARLGLRRVEVLNHIENKEYSKAYQMIDLMVRDFKNEPALQTNGGQDLTTALFQAGKELTWRGRYIEAKDAFDRIIEIQPNSSAIKEAKLWSARADVCILIITGKDEQALSTIDNLIIDFEGDAGLPEAVYWISKQYEWTKGTTNDRTGWYDAPNNIYQRLTQKFGDTSFGKDAEWDQKRLTHRMKIFKLMKEPDQNAVDAAIEKMVIEFTDRPELAEELRWIAIGYEENPMTMLKAKEIYDRVAREFPGTIESDNSTLDSRRIDIDVLYKDENDTGGDLLLERFVQDFGFNTNAGPCIKSLAWGSYQEGIKFERLGHSEKAQKYYERAIRIYKTILDNLPTNPSSTPESLYYIGEVCDRIGKRKEAIPYLKRLVLEWPDYKYTSRAESILADCLKEK